MEMMVAAGEAVGLLGKENVGVSSRARVETPASLPLSFV